MQRISPIEDDGGDCLIPIEWSDCVWEPRIQRLASPARRLHPEPIKSLPATAALRHPARRKTRKPEPPAASRAALLKPGGSGKNILKPQTNQNRTMLPSSFSLMKKHSRRSRRFDPGFTLVELLTVIAIIAILAAMLLPVLSHVKLQALKTQTRIQVNDIATAIQAYDSAYGRFPVSQVAQQQAAANAAAGGNPDFTYGGMFTSASGTFPIGTPVPSNNGGGPLTNSEVIAILMDYTNFPNPSFGTSFANANNQKNPQKTQFLNAKMSGYDSLMTGNPSPGVGNDLVYRDLWGNPFIISFDLNYDGQCQDSFYCLDTVSQNPTAPPSPYAPTGFNGLNNPNATAATQQQKDSFQFHGGVMVWSMGPNGPATPSVSSFNSTKPATDPANKNHILSWQ